MRVVLTVLAVLSLSIRASGEEKAKTDLDELQGKWKVVYTETNGEKGFKPEEGTAGFLKFAKDTCTEYTAVAEACVSSFKIDPTKRPKWLDLTIEKNKLIPESKGTAIPCLYEFEKDRLKIRWPNQGFLGCSYRAKGMAVEKGSAGTLVIYERVKP